MTAVVAAALGLGGGTEALAETPADAGGSEDVRGHEGRPLTAAERIEAATVQVGDCPSSRRGKIHNAQRHREQLRDAFQGVTENTVEEARAIAAMWWAGREREWLRIARSRGAAEATMVAPERSDGRWLRDLVRGCPAWASGKPSSCNAIEDPQLRVVCQGLTHAVATKGDPAQCATLAEPARSVCALGSNDASRCTTDDPVGRQVCEAARANGFSDPGRCEPERIARDPATCLFGTAVLGASQGESACDIMKPGATRPDTLYAPIHAMCRAILAADASRCPAQRSSEQPTALAPIHAAAQVGVTRDLAPEVVVYIRPRDGQLCWTSVAVSQRGLPTQLFQQVLSRPDDAIADEIIARWPVRADFDPFAARAQLTTLCVSGVFW